MFEQAELRGTPMGPNDPPDAKGTPQIASKIALLENCFFGMGNSTKIPSPRMDSAERPTDPRLRD